MMGMCHPCQYGLKTIKCYPLTVSNASQITLTSNLMNPKVLTKMFFFTTSVNALHNKVNVRQFTRSCFGDFLFNGCNKVQDWLGGLVH